MKICSVNPDLINKAMKISLEDLQIYENIQKKNIKLQVSGKNPKIDNVHYVFNQVDCIMKNGFFTPQERVSYRTDCFSMANQFGCAHIFGTVSPNGLDSTVVKFWCGLMDEPNFLVCQVPVKFTYLSGFASAEYFNYLIEYFIRNLLKFDIERHECSGVGIFGKVKAFNGCVESQCTTNLHLHFLCWIHGLFFFKIIFID